jgi:hypothetical protein
MEVFSRIQAGLLCFLAAGNITTRHCDRRIACNPFPPGANANLPCFGIQPFLNPKCAQDGCDGAQTQALFPTGTGNALAKDDRHFKFTSWNNRN